MNSFYKLPKFSQWLIAIFMAIVAIGIILCWTKFTYGFLAIFTFFLVIPPFQFLSTPIITLTGGYKYLSPMFLVFNANDKKYDLHSGTSFDYLMVLRKIKAGKAFQNRVLSYYIEGLLEVIRRIEAKELPETVEVRGSSYFFSERAAERMGFEVSKTGVFEILNLIANYIDLTWTYSLSKGKLSFPNLRNIKTASIVGAKLVSNKEKLTKLHKYLNRNASQI